MGRLSSSLAAWLGRLLKVVMAAVVLPFGVALLGGILAQLGLISASGGTVRQWIEWGAMTYLGVHVLLYRPVPLFHTSHRLFSTLAVWLFGGHVASVEQAGGGKGKGTKETKGKGGPAAQGSTLVAFSPYVIPLSAMLVSAAGWGLGRWLDHAMLDGPAAFLIGMAMAFHWLMTADDLQQQRTRWHLETYLLAIGLVFVVTLLIGSACLPWTVPEFSFLQALGEAFRRTQAIYATLIQQLFL